MNKYFFSSNSFVLAFLFAALVFVTVQTTLSALLLWIVDMILGTSLFSLGNAFLLGIFLFILSALLRPYDLNRNQS